MSPRDQLVNVSYGNLATDVWTYGPANGQMSAMVSSVPGGSQLANLAYGYDDVGNLIEQDNQLLDVRETFFYDQLQRLTWREFIDLPNPAGPGGPSAPVQPDPQPKPFIDPEGVEYQYDALGNILTKSDYGDNYEYDHVKHQICANSGLNSLAEHPGPHAVTQVTAQVKSSNGGTTPQDYRMAYDANGNLICSEDGSLTVQYDAFNLPTSIQRGVTQSFHYGPDLQRYRQVKGQNTETLYIDKLYERKQSNSQNIERFYVGGYLVIERSSAGQDTHSYTHKDRLGSTVAITDGAGDIKVQQGFGPFGKARTANWDATDFLPGRNYDSRGFTDHEHLENTRLIHMNGRGYDFNLGRFLSIDPIIQFPENSQSLNPYSYLMNNPMAGTDPTGYMSCSADDPSGCVEAAEGLGDGESIDVKATQTGSRIAKKVGSISNNGGTISVSDNNGNVVGSSSGTTSTGSGPSGGGQQGIAGLGSPGQTGNQNSSSPNAQGDDFNTNQDTSSSFVNTGSEGKPGGVITEFNNIKTIRDVDSVLDALRELVGDDAVIQEQVSRDIRKTNLIGAAMMSVDISESMILQAQISQRINENQNQALAAIGIQLGVGNLASGGFAAVRVTQVTSGFIAPRVATLTNDIQLLRGTCLAASLCAASIGIDGKIVYKPTLRVVTQLQRNRELKRDILREASERFKVVIRDK